MKEFILNLLYGLGILFFGVILGYLIIQGLSALLSTSASNVWMILVTSTIILSVSWITGIHIRGLK